MRCISDFRGAPSAKQILSCIVHTVSMWQHHVVHVKDQITTLIAKSTVDQHSRLKTLLQYTMVSLSSMSIWHYICICLTTVSWNCLRKKHDGCWKIFCFDDLAENLSWSLSWCIFVPKIAPLGPIICLHIISWHQDIIIAFHRNAIIVRKPPAWIVHKCFFSST